jgi:hypothetical protein
LLLYYACRRLHRHYAALTGHPRKNKGQAVDFLVKYSKQDRKDSADTYDYFVTKLRAFSADGRISDSSYKRMTDALVDWGDLKQRCRRRLSFSTRASSTRHGSSGLVTGRASSVRRE